MKYKESIESQAPHRRTGCLTVKSIDMTSFNIKIGLSWMGQLA